MLRELLSLLLAVSIHGNQTVTMRLVSNDASTWSGEFSIPLSDNVLAWEVQMTFNKPVSDLKSRDGTISPGAQRGTSFTLVNKFDHGFHRANDVINVSVAGSYVGPDAPQGTGMFVNLTTGPQTVSPLVTVPASMQKTSYNYMDVLAKSLLFYEAQRSGRLPADNRIPWRADSALGDTGNHGEDLSGGYYDAGDLIKFNYPMAHTSSLLSWGYLQWPDTFSQSGQGSNLRSAVKWALDYFLKCHISEHELYVQVGTPEDDHHIWGRPENMTMPRPAFKIDETHPGSDVAAETAAAMAAGYLVLKPTDSAYAAKLLTHARQLFDFAVKFPGLYTKSLQLDTYGTGSFTDEMTWAAAWLYKATGEDKYRKYAMNNRVSKPNGGASWEDKTSYADVLLYNLTGDAQLRADVVRALAHWLPGGTTPYTPGGFVFAGKWGSLRNAANVVLVALMAAESGINPTVYRCWGRRQINYALGNNPANRSYVIGFGNNPPSHYHHRPSSCPNMIAPCGFESFNNPGPNPHTLYGGLVGGPGPNDDYDDVRSDYVKNEVALDYNAGFQSSIAGLMHLTLNNQLPTDCP